MSTPAPTMTAPPSQRPPTARGPAARILGVITVLFGALLLLAGISWALSSTEVTTVAVPETVTRVTVEADTGGVELVSGAESSVTSTLRSSPGRSPIVDVDVVDGELQVRSRCPNIVLPLACRASHVIAVPADVDVFVDTSAGGIRVDGITGDLDTSSSAGGIRISGAEGPVRAVTSAGGITVEGASTDIEARSSAGGVTITTTEAPDRIEARSSAGGITVTVPDEVYAVSADSSAGGVTVDVRTDPSSQRSIHASSSAGGVTVRRS